MPSYAVYRPILRHNLLIGEPLWAAARQRERANGRVIDHRASWTIGRHVVPDLRLWSCTAWPVALPETAAKLLAGPDDWSQPMLKHTLAGRGGSGQDRTAVSCNSFRGVRYQPGDLWQVGPRSPPRPLLPALHTASTKARSSERAPPPRVGSRT